MARRDFYQTDTHVHVSIYARNLRKDSVHFTPESQSFSVFAHADYDNPSSSTPSAPPVQQGGDPADDSNVIVVLRKLFAHIDPARSSFTAHQNKIELHLAKVQVGVQWPYLNKDEDSPSSSSSLSKPPTATPACQGTPIPTPAPISTASTIPADAPKRKKNKWESFKVDDDDDDEEAGAGGAGASASTGGAKGSADVNDFFKQLYEGANDDARRAMIKSYQESNGTTLSMNWDEVKKAKVETRPPDSMVAKKYGE